MRTASVLVAVAAVVALASAVTYTPPKRGCPWNVEMAFKDDNGQLLRKWVYYVNGRFIAKYDYNADGSVAEHDVFRPDLNNNTYTYKSGECKKNIYLMDFDKGLMKSLGLPSEWSDCDTNAKYNGKDVIKYSNTLFGSGVTLFVDKKSNDPIGITVKIVGFGGTADLKFGGSAGMGAFAFSNKESGCEDGLYKAGNDDYAFCAAYSVKAALALVLAAIATALLSLF